MQQHKLTSQNQNSADLANTPSMATLTYQVVVLIFKLLLRLAAKSLHADELREFQEQADNLPVPATVVVEPTVAPASPPPPEHVDVAWIIDYLQIHRSNFYRNVHEKLLHPILKIGRRPYFLRSEVEALFRTHESGAHTFSKLAKQAAASGT